MQKFYGEYGLDDVSLQELRERDDGYIAYLSHLFEVVSRPIDTENRDQQDDDREIVTYAKELLKEHAVTTEVGALDLVGMIRIREAAGVRDVQVVENVFDDIHSEFLMLSNTPAPLETEVAKIEQNRGEQLAYSLNQFADIATQTLNADQVYTDANYLTHSYFYNCCIKEKFSEPTTLDDDELWLANEMIGLERVADLDRDTAVPFEISKGRFALFGVDGNVLYIADEEYSDEIRQECEALHERIRYRVTGQHFARRVVADIPDDIGPEPSEFIDASAQLGRDAYPELFRDKELLRDFLYLQKAHMRDTLEHDFGIELKSLSIKEQVYFLNYLKHVTVAEAETMQHLTSLYGVDGMRTFLALERGDESLGDAIVAFGQHEEVARPVFALYSELLDAADNAEQVLNETLADKGQEETVVKEQVRQTILN